MSLSCLTCQGMQRTNSDVSLDLEPLDPRGIERFPSGTHRNWSGCLVWTPQDRVPHVRAPQEQMRSGQLYSSVHVVPKAPRKLMQKLASSSVAEMEERAAAIGGEPRLIRSGGMRRDWSFEDLNKSLLVMTM